MKNMATRLEFNYKLTPYQNELILPVCLESGQFVKLDFITVPSLEVDINFIHEMCEMSVKCPTHSDSKYRNSEREGGSEGGT